MEKKCDGKCETCNVNQRSYCAAQIAYYVLEELTSIKASLQMSENVKPIIIRSEPNVPGAENNE